MLSTFCAPIRRCGWSRPSIALATLLVSTGMAYGQDTALTLEAAVRLATTEAPSVAAAQSSVTAGSQAAVKAGQLPNPMLAAGIDSLPINGPNSFTIGQDMLTMRRVGVEQEWVSSEKRRLRVAQAQQAVGQEQATYLQQFVRVRQLTVQAWLSATYAKKDLALRREVVDHMIHELRAVRAAYRGAKSPVSAVTQANVMLAQAQDQLLKADQDWRTALISLSRWVGTPVADIAGEPPTPQSTVAAFTVDQLRAVQPTLIAAAQAIRAADADTAVARSNRDPNWTWDVSYLQGGNSSRYVSVGVSIPLPINRANVEDRDLAEKAALGNKARYTFQDAQRDVQAEIQTLATTLTSGRQRVESLRRSLLPAAEQAVQVASAAYRGGSGTLAEVFAARRAQLDARLQVLDLEREVAMTWAQLDYQVVPPTMAVIR
ncbi:TolC family protein [Achromobacter aloeverae]